MRSAFERLPVIMRSGLSGPTAAVLGQPPDGVDSNGGVPYLPPSLYPPDGSINIDQNGYVNLGAAAPGPLQIVVAYYIKPGYNAIIKAIANNIVGGGFAEGSGAVKWMIGTAQSLTSPLGFIPFEGYNNVISSLGLPVSPTVLPGFIRVRENQVVMIVVQNQGLVVAPPGPPVGGRFMGWAYTKEDQEKNAWV